MPCSAQQQSQEVSLDSALAVPGLRLDEASQQEGVSGSEAPEEVQPQSPQQRPPNHLSAMLTYMAQVALSCIQSRDVCLKHNVYL